MRPVDFLLVGQPKSGTTALATFLDEHPGISIAVPKEPGYFAADLRQESVSAHGGPGLLTVRDEREYAACFASATPSQRIGDASTWYLYSELAAQTSHDHNPHARVIALLRDPVAMIASLHRQYLNEAIEDITDFASALAAEHERAQGRQVPPRAPVPSLLLYRRRAHYGEQLERWITTFGREAVLVATADDLRQDPADTYRRVCEHLGVDPGFAPTFRPVHEAAQPRSPSLNRLVRSRAVKAPVRAILGPRRYTRLQKRVVEPALMTTARRSPLSPDLEAQLRSELRPHVQRASELIGRDLAAEWWGERELRS